MYAMTDSSVGHVFESLKAPAYFSKTIRALSRRTWRATTSAMYALRPRGPATASTSARTSAGSVMFVRTIPISVPPSVRSNAHYPRATGASTASRRAMRGPAAMPSATPPMTAA